MRRLSLFIVVGFSAALIVCHVAAAQPTRAPSSVAVSSLEEPIYDCERQVTAWTRAKNLEIAFLVLTLALGAVISALQASKMSSVKVITVVLGIVTAILTGVNSTVFPADVKTLRRAIVDGDAVIQQLWVKLHTLQRYLDGQHGRNQEFEKPRAGFTASCVCASALFATRLDAKNAGRNY
jgi:hypothetical protein